MFGLNNAQLIGRLGADATISHLTNGGRVANVSIATDEATSTSLVFHDAPCWDCEVEPADLVVLPFPCTPYGPGEVKPHRSISSDTGSDVRPELE